MRTFYEKARVRSTHKELVDIAAEARARHMTYGQYQAMLYAGKIRPNSEVEELEKE